MQKSVSFEFNQKIKDGHVSNLLNSMRKTDSKSLAWPTSKVRTGKSHGHHLKRSQLSDIPLAESAASSHLKAAKRRGPMSKTEYDKVKFYNFLNNSENKYDVKKNKKRKKLAHSRKHHEKAIPNLYVVPTRNSAAEHRQGSLSGDINDMLKDISVRRPSDVGLKRRNQNKETNRGSSSSERELKLKEKLAAERDLEKRIDIAISSTSVTSLKKKPDKVKRMKKQKKVAPKSDEDDTDSVEPEELLEFLKTIKKISPKHGTGGHAGAYRYKKHKSYDNRGIKASMMQKYEAVNRDVVKALDDHEMKAKFLKNIKKLASKEYTVYRNKFMESSKVPNVKNPYDVEQYIDNMDKMVRRARLSFQKRGRAKNPLDEDNISQDLLNIETMRSKGHTVTKSRDFIKNIVEPKEQTIVNPEIVSVNPSYASIISDNYFGQPYTLENSEESSDIDFDRDDINRSSSRYSKYGEPIVVKRRDRLNISQFEGELDVPLAFETPISLEEMAKLSPEEFSKLFSRLKRDTKSMNFRKASLALLKSDPPLTYKYRWEQVKKYLYQSDVSLSTLDSITIDDIDLTQFLNYPYPDKYFDLPIEPKIVPSIHKIETTNNENVKRPIPKISETKIKPNDVPNKTNCFICNAIKRNMPIRDDPLIIRMKNELKRQELKAYIQQKQRFNTDFTKLFNRNSRILVPCEKPRTMYNQIYTAKRSFRNNA